MTTSKKMRASQRQETAAAATIGGRTTPRSGAGWVRKNDAHSKHFLVECKRTDNKFRLSLGLAALDELEQNALGAGKLPAMSAQMGDRTFWVLTDTTFEELLLAAGWT